MQLIDILTALEVREAARATCGEYADIRVQTCCYSEVDRSLNPPVMGLFSGRNV
jgi:hypothetical protein